MSKIKNSFMTFAGIVLSSAFFFACTNDAPFELHGSKGFDIDDKFNVDQSVANAVNDDILSRIATSSRSSSGEPIYPPYYGGSYIEPDGHLTLYVVGDSLKAVSQLKRVVDSSIINFDSSIINYCVANYSYQELCEVNEAILTCIENWPKNVAKNVSAFGLNVKNNAVEVYLVDASLQCVREFKSFYNHPCLMFSQAGKFVDEATNINPGDKVCKTIYTNNKYGSIAFRAKEKSGSKRVGFVTAGHVLAVNESAYINSIKMGTCVKSVNEIGGIADAAFVVIDSDQIANFTLQNYVNGVVSAPLSTTISDPGAGTYVNKWGAETGKTGGYIKNTHFNITDEDGVVLRRDVASADYESSEGDSGGLVYTIISSSNTRYTVGVHSGRLIKSNLAVYSLAGNVLSTLGIERY